MSKLYHQTDPPTAEIILATQQMKPGNGGLAGGGIYFATTPELTAHKAHKSGVILEATVQLGKILVLDKEGDPDMTLQKLKSMGYDSVCIQRAVSSGQEYVVYDPEQVLSTRSRTRQGRERVRCQAFARRGARGCAGAPVRLRAFAAALGEPSQTHAAAGVH